MATPRRKDIGAISRTLDTTGTGGAESVVDGHHNPKPKGYKEPKGGPAPAQTIAGNLDTTVDLADSVGRVAEDPDEVTGLTSEDPVPTDVGATIGGDVETTDGASVGTQAITPEGQPGQNAEDVAHHDEDDEPRQGEPQALEHEAVNAEGDATAEDAVAHRDPARDEDPSAPGTTTVEGAQGQQDAAQDAQSEAAEGDDTPQEDNDAQERSESDDLSAEAEQKVEGNVSDVKEWVHGAEDEDETKQRAQAALEAEKAGKDRSTLKADLEAIIAGNDDEG